MRNLFRYASLGKIRIMIPVSLTGFSGYFLFCPALSSKIFFVTLGLLILGISASALNQVQESEIDSMMQRTSSRPVPSGLITKKGALIFSFITLITGTVLVLIAGNIVSMLIGLLTMFWYNIVYTYSKRVTPFAIFPGAVTGALPPLIGWTAAGGSICDKTILFVAFLLFVGQMPHFWLILLKYGSDYKKSGLPCLIDLMTRNQIKRLAFSWTLASAISAVFLYVFGIIQTEIVAAVLLVLTVLLIWKNFELLKVGDDTKTRIYQMRLNIYFLLVLILLVSDRIISAHILQ